MTELQRKENRLLLELLAKALFAAAVQPSLDGISLPSLMAEAKHQSVLGICFEALPKQAETLEGYADWQLYCMRVVQENLRNKAADSALHVLLQAADIPHCTLKGNAAAAYYPQPELRQMGDIDVLIRPEDAGRVQELLLKNGFTLSDNDSNYHVGYRKNRMEYELHTDISRVTETRRGIFALAGDLLASAKPLKTAVGEILVPSAFAHGFVMLVHMQHHLEDRGGIGLRHICDWAVFVNALSDAEFEEIFCHKLKTAGLWRFAKAVSWVASRYLQMPPKPWMGPEDAALTQALMEDLLLSGNFGRKDAQRLYGSTLISGSDEKRSMAGNFFSAVSHMVYRKWPFYRRQKWLLPVGFTAYGAWTLGRMASGRIHLNPIKLAKSGADRNALYGKLHLFEAEE